MVVQHRRQVCHHRYQHHRRESLPERDQPERRSAKRVTQRKVRVRRRSASRGRTPCAGCAWRGSRLIPVRHQPVVLRSVADESCDGYHHRQRDHTKRQRSQRPAEVVLVRVHRPRDSRNQHQRPQPSDCARIAHRLRLVAREPVVQHGVHRQPPAETLPQRHNHVHEVEHQRRHDDLHEGRQQLERQVPHNRNIPRVTNLAEQQEAHAQHAQPHEHHPPDSQPVNEIALDRPQYAPFDAREGESQGKLRSVPPERRLKRHEPQPHRMEQRHARRHVNDAADRHKPPSIEHAPHPRANLCRIERSHVESQTASLYI